MLRSTRPKLLQPPLPANRHQEFRDSTDTERIYFYIFIPRPRLGYPQVTPIIGWYKYHAHDVIAGCFYVRQSNSQHPGQCDVLLVIVTLILEEGVAIFLIHFPRSFFRPKILFLTLRSLWPSSTCDGRMSDKQATDTALDKHRPGLWHYWTTTCVLVKIAVILLLCHCPGVWL